MLAVFGRAARLIDISELAVLTNVQVIVWPATLKAAGAIVSVLPASELVMAVLFWSTHDVDVRV